jgi:predicted RNA binding protein YcfA (HicA-like mRNA interferase family)
MLKTHNNWKKPEYFRNWKDVSAMMPEHVKFGQIRDMLHSLGFEEKRVEGSHIRFKNPYTDAVIVLPDRKIITPNHFRMAEKVLEENGMISREAFEKFFQ